MACQACNVKFSLFKRKRQCMDCLRYFCSECVIRRQDQTLSCDSCSMLSRRPLVRDQVAQMRLRDLRQYLVAKKVCVKGCVEKDDLVNLLMRLANECGQHSEERARFGLHFDPSNHANLINDTENFVPNSAGQTEYARSFTEAADPNLEFQNAPSVEEGNNPLDATNLAGRAELGDPSGTASADGTSSAAETESVSEIYTAGEAGHTLNATDTERDDAVNHVLNPENQVPQFDSHSEQSSGEIRGESASNPSLLSEDFGKSSTPKSALVKLSDISDPSQLAQLSVKQLKTLLDTNRVDYKGCIERSELLVRASRLWKEFKQARADIDKLDEGEICKICWDAPIECVILECGHMACCVNCGKQMSECPICKQYIVRIVRFFKA